MRIDKGRVILPFFYEVLKMFYVMDRNYNIVSKHETRQEAVAAKTEKQHVTDEAGIKVLIYGLSPSQLAISGS